jgi:hypothetical protein
MSGASVRVYLPEVFDGGLRSVGGATLGEENTEISSFSRNAVI